MLRKDGHINDYLCLAFALGVLFYNRNNIDFEEFLFAVAIGLIGCFLGLALPVIGHQVFTTNNMGLAEYQASKRHWGWWSCLPDRVMDLKPIGLGG